MRYNLDEPAELDAAFTYLSKLAGKHAQVEVKKIVPPRSLKQNAYLHLLIAAFGLHFGYTAEEAKMVYKYINRHIYSYKRPGKDIVFWRSSADIDQDQMRISIDRFRVASSRAGYDLPTALDQDWLRQLHNEVEQAHAWVEDLPE